MLKILEKIILKLSLHGKKPITRMLPISFKIQIYDEKINLMLFGYFISSKKAIMIYNKSRNLFSRL